MRTKANVLILIIGFLFLLSRPAQAAYSLELGMWSSPYGPGRLFSAKAAYHRQINESFSLGFLLGGQFENELLLLEPQTTLLWHPPLTNSTSWEMGLTYDWQKSLWQWEATWKVTADPLVSYLAVAASRQKATWEGGVVFAANERWALGAHLQYMQNSLWTYQIHHYSPQGLHQVISYSRSLDGSLQRLGFQIGF